MEKLCARENPALHEASIVGFPKVDMGKYRNEDLINAIASSEGRILDFFTEEFSVINRYKRTNTFIFPYIGNVIDQMLQNGRKEVEKLLVASVHHNRKTYKQLKALVDEAHEFQCSFFDDIDEETSKEMMKKVRRDINMDESNSIISFYDSRGKYDSRGLVTNIVRTVCSSTNPSIKRLVEELNDLYRQIINLKEGDDENGEAIL